MKLISTAALLLLSSCCAFRSNCPEKAAAPAKQAATKDDDVAYKVIPLRFASADEMAAVLRNSVTKQGGRRPPLIIADERTNSLVVSGAPEQLPLVEKLIAQLDVDVQKQK
jgi:type II secretory pathway component GspD/PulD (secretin)